MIHENNNYPKKAYMHTSLSILGSSTRDMLFIDSPDNLNPKRFFMDVYKSP